MCHAMPFVARNQAFSHKNPPRKENYHPTMPFVDRRDGGGQKKKTGIFWSFCNALKINYLFFFAAFLAAAASVASYMTGVPIMMEA